jgi:hypothetical protein
MEIQYSYSPTVKRLIWVNIGKQKPGIPFSKLLDPRLMQQ